MLESVEGSERWARYSFLGTRPYLVFKSRGKNIEVVEEGKKRQLTADEPLRALEGLLKEHRPATVDGMPPFFGGAPGYVASDAVEQFHGSANTKKTRMDCPKSSLSSFRL